ncbi:hypothetical protein KFE25_009132 [Diacronema lutheri]|uniref:DM10 domain-containing protein n=1 Tax=Diacronema lutheri TaxID=2081491 RepID=A0A8J5XK33_DIALT|nr:hypothetical protein KFE25_009132 [Diacronema lutheri]
MVVLTFYAHTREDVAEEERTFLFTDAHRVRRFRINYDLDLDAITVDEFLHELRAAEGNRIERARWRPFLRKSDQDGGQHVRVPRASARAPEEFHVHRSAGRQTPRATAQDAALDPGWQGEGVDKVNLRIHWPPERGAAARKYVQLGDFAIGKAVTIYGRQFHISDATAETRAFCAQAGLPLRPPAAVPEDDYFARQEALLADERERRARAPVAGDEHFDFLEHERRWRAAPKPATRDHRAQRGGGLRSLPPASDPSPLGAGPQRHEPRVFAATGSVLRFWLRPDVAIAPDPKERTRSLLLRCCLDRSSELDVLELVELHDGAHMAPDAPVLIRARRAWCEERALTAAGERPNAPHPARLRVGEWAWLGAQRYFVLACDAPTRAWLDAQPAATRAPPMPPNFALDHSPHARPAADTPLGVAPARRGFDPLVRPAPVVRPGVQPADGTPTLRFAARLADAPHAGQLPTQQLARGAEVRAFVLDVPPDLRLSVRELAASNGGRQGGLVVRPPAPTEPVGHAYALRDFRLGGIVRVGAFTLLLHHADEATLAWQEARPDVFPEADIDRILRLRTAELVERLHTTRAAVPWARGADSRMRGVVDLDGFLRVLRGVSTPPFEPLAGLSLAEATTLFRAFREPGRQLLDLAILERALERSAESLEPGARPRAL